MIEQQTLSPLIARFADRIEEGIQRASELGHSIILSVSEEIDPVDPLRLFTNSAHYATERWYWEHPEEQLAIAGAGLASSNIFPAHSRFAEASRIQREIASTALTDTADGSAHPGIRFFSAFSFDPERKPDRRVWRGFPAVYLLVPRVMLLRQNERCSLVFNLRITDRRGAETVMRSLEQLYQRTWDALNKEIQQTDPRVDIGVTPEGEEIAARFRENVTKASDAIRRGEFEKVVLARYRDITTGNYFDIPRALDKLRNDYPGCYTFAVARQGSVFLGASPEQLARQNGSEVSVASLAGSIRRGSDSEEDEQLANQLLNSAKDQHEHEICARAIREAVEPLCANIDVPEKPQILSFSNVHHLYTPISGTLSNGSTLFDLVERLHPTPAVGGYPKEPARDFLREHEGFDRGWYASPIGWLDGDGNGEFLVALRSAIVSGQRARLFAGCGIVAESDPDQELAESDVKMRPMISALGSDDS
jgi:isochorismate synthase